MFFLFLVVLRKLRGAYEDELINDEMNELAAEKALRSKQNTVTYRDLFMRPSLRRPLILTIVIQISQVKKKKNFFFFFFFFSKGFFPPLRSIFIIFFLKQFSGINSIAYYSTNMFISIGLDAKTWAVYATIIIDIFKVSITVVCMFLIEIAGRRKLLIVGLTGMSFFSFALAIFPAVTVSLLKEIILL